MAQPAALFDSFDAIGQRESLADKIFLITPTDSPLVSAIRKVKAEAINEEWQIDKLAVVDVTNARIEGDDAALIEPTKTIRVSNRCQILSKAFGVSGSLEAVRKAGRAKELGYQLSKSGAEIKRDLEAILLNAQVIGTAALARSMGGLPSWISVNSPAATTPSTASMRGIGGAPGTTPNGLGTVLATDGALRTFNQTMIDTGMKNAWESGGHPTLLMMGAVQRGVFSTFDGIATDINTQAAQKVIVSVADVYKSNFGDLRAVENRYIRKTSSVDREVYGIDTDLLELAELRPFHIKELAVSGDSEKRLLLWEGTLKVLNEAGHFVIADLQI
jgi:hypothetical protein